MGTRPHINRWLKAAGLAACLTAVVAAPQARAGETVLAEASPAPNQGAELPVGPCRAVLVEIKFAYVGYQIGWLYKLDPTAPAPTQDARRRQHEDQEAMWRWTELYAGMGCPLEAVGTTIAEARQRLDKLVAKPFASRTGGPASQ